MENPGNLLKQAEVKHTEAEMKHFIATEVASLSYNELERFNMWVKETSASEVHQAYKNWHQEQPEDSVASFAKYVKEQMLRRCS